jgi:hypothetical protein
MIDVPPGAAKRLPRLPHFGAPLRQGDIVSPFGDRQINLVVSTNALLSDPERNSLAFSSVKDRSPTSLARRLLLIAEDKKSLPVQDDSSL